jgi:hypothetical protein
MSSVGPNQRIVLSKSSDLATQNAFERLSNYLNSSEWLSSSNCYRSNTTHNIEQDLSSGRSINHQDLSEYIAASALLHCSDAWSFLGRSVENLTRGDRDCARHFAYYAELRAAISLLATNGIGIFDKKHIVLDSAGFCHYINGQTHVMAWSCLEAWADLNLSSSRFLLPETIQFHGNTLNEWLNYFWPGGTSTPNLVTKEWLQTWGLDLQRLSMDRDSRNESSYRPTRLNRIHALNVSETSDFICDFWKLFEPSGQSLFELIDKHILRLSLERWYLSLTGKKVDNNPRDFENRIRLMLNKASLSDNLQKQLLEFFVRRSDVEDPIIFKQARGTAPFSDQQHHLQVISRAVLLLRIATASCSYLIQSTNINKSHLEFWCNELGEERGLWDPGEIPEDLQDLWEDISDAIKDLEQWSNNNNPGSLSYAKWRRECSFSISMLGGCELIAMWGFGF